MPDWLTIVLGIIGAIGTILGILGVTAYMGERAKKKAQRRIQEEDHVQELQNQEYENILRKIIREENKPIVADLVEIKKNLALNTEGTVTLLRNDMKKSLDWYTNRGYATGNDKASWMELYNTYGKLGGNHFKEYVDGWKDDVKNLPVEKKKTKSKQRLVETKK